MKYLPRICLSMAMLCSPLTAQQRREGQESVAAQLAQTDRLADPQELAAFFDGLMAACMDSQHIAGAAVVVVKNGEIFLSKGYGYADLAKKIEVNPESTLFRAGSVGKLITWTAVMQLVEQGKIDLDSDINTYLKDFKIPATFPQPITMKHLLTHSPGFEDFVLGLFARTPADLSTLGRTLREKMPARVFPPGETIAYSNYGAALAGYIVEQVSGLAYETYVEKNIFEPLGMSRSTVRQPLPASLKPDMAIGYKFADGRYQPQAFELFKGLTPAGSMSATVNDMAKFMIAHLEQGRQRSGRILNEETMRMMHSRMFASDPRCSGMAGGFWEYRHNNLRLLEHGGDTLFFHTLLDLIPEKKVGIYLAYSGGSAGGPRMTWIRAFLDRYFPGPEPSVPGTLAGQKERLEKCVGYYWMSRSTLKSMDKLEILLSQIRIKATADGRLLFRNKTWIEIEPMVFQENRGQDKIVFQLDKSGAVKRMLYSRMPPVIFLRAPWHLNPNLHALLLLFCLLLFLSTLRWSLGALWRRICKKADHWGPVAARWRLTDEWTGNIEPGIYPGISICAARSAGCNLWRSGAVEIPADPAAAGAGPGFRNRLARGVGLGEQNRDRMPAPVLFPAGSGRPAVSMAALLLEPAGIQVLIGQARKLQRQAYFLEPGGYIAGPGADGVPVTEIADGRLDVLDRPAGEKAEVPVVHRPLEEDRLHGPDTVGHGLQRLGKAPALGQLDRVSLAGGAAGKQPQRPFGQRFFVVLQEPRRRLAPAADVDGAAQDNGLVGADVGDTVGGQHLGGKTRLGQHPADRFSDLFRGTILAGIGHQNLGVHFSLLFSGATDSIY